MSAYDKLRKSKNFLTKLDLAVLYYGEDCVDEVEARDAEQAAAELARLRAIETALVDFLESVSYKADRKAYFRKVSQKTIDKLAAALERKL